MTASPALVLASASPRRHRLLREAGVAFTAMPADLDESPLPGERPTDLATRLARDKATAVARRLEGPPRWVLGADTIVVLGERVLGKPRDAAHARELLASLCGRAHTVITGVALVKSDTLAARETRALSEVELRAADADEIRDYVATGESLDKAGAYALQGEGRRFVVRVAGSETNVIGLPMAETLALLAAAGLAPEPGP